MSTTNSFRVGGAIQIGDNGASNYSVALAPTAPLTGNRTVTFPNTNCDLQYAAQMNQTVATSASPQFVQPTLTNGLKVGDNGASAFTAEIKPVAPLTANRAVTLPNADCDLTYASQMNQSVATGTSPQFVQPTLTNGLKIGDNGASLFTAEIRPVAPLTGNRTVTFPNANCDLTYASQMDQSVATGTSPTFQQPLVKLGLDIEDPGVGTKKVTLNAAAGMGSDYTVTLPATIGAQDNALTVSSVAGSVATIGFANNVPADTMDISGFAGWGAFSGGAGVYWTYAKPNFTLQCAGYGYIRGKRVNWTAPQSVACVVNESNYIYIDTNGVLRRTNTDSTDSNLYIYDIPLFELLDDNAMAAPFVKKENHPVQFNSTISEYFHHNIGNIIRGPGAILTRKTTGTGAAITDRQFHIVGEDYNEDHGLVTLIPDGGGVVQTAMYFYKNAAGKWIVDSSSTSPPLKWNNAGTATTLTAGRRGVLRMYVNEDPLNTTTPQYSGILHTSEFATLADANTAISNGTITGPDNELATMELTQLGYLVVRNQGANGYIEQITIQKNTINNRYTGGAASSSHLTLSDLTGGQYSDGGHSRLTQRYEVAAAPALDSDIQLYRTGSLWVDSTNTAVVNSYNTDIYLCSDTTLSHAVWHGLGWWTSTVPDRRKGAVVSGYQALLYGPTAQYNIALGYNALIGKSDAPITGTDNYAIGRLAIGCTAAGTHSGTYNTAFGYSALSALTTGSKNHCCGYQAGDSITTGGSNIAIGDDADCAAALSYQIAIGASASCVSAESICIGYGAALGAGSSDSIAIGRLAGAATVTGTTNILIGTTAGAAITSGTYNIGIGYQAGNAISTGAGNIAIGNDADCGAAISNQIAIGHSSLCAGTTSICIGDSAKTSGVNGVSIGNGAGNSTITGTDNIGIGRSACYNVVAGTHNVGIGYATLGGGTGGGSGNVAIGQATLYGITSGSNNIGIGYAVAYGATSGNDNTGIGNEALRGLTTGSNNVGIGKYAGNTISSGSNNISIGINSDCAAAVDDQIAIGNTAFTGAVNAIAIGETVGCNTSGGIAMGHDFTVNAGNDTVFFGKGGGISDVTYCPMGTINWQVGSDERQKNILGTIPFGIDFINKVNPIEYTVKSDASATKCYGFGAQSLKAAMVEIGFDSFPGYSELLGSDHPSVSLIPFIPVLVRACQQLSAENDALETTVAAQTAEIAAMKSDLAAIKTQLGL